MHKIEKDVMSSPQAGKLDVNAHAVYRCLWFMGLCSDRLLLIQVCKPAAPDKYQAYCCAEFVPTNPAVKCAGPAGGEA